MYVEKIVIHNFRCFADTTIDLNYPGRTDDDTFTLPLRNANVNLLLGDNGSGKSSVFKALTLAVMSPVIRSSGFQAEYLVRRPVGEIEEARFGASGQSTPSNRPQTETASVEVTVRLSSADAPNESPHEHTAVGRALIRRFGDVETVDSDPNTDDSVWENMFYNDSPAFFIAGYGANRRTERPEGYSEQKRSRRYQRVASLFEENVGLAPFSYACLELQTIGAFDEARVLLNALLPDQVQLTSRQDNQKRSLFEHAGIFLPFDALSDGFRTFIGWAWDLLLQLARVQQTAYASEETNLGRHAVTVQKFPASSLTAVEGVVIIDEIDLLLHPEWQRTVIDRVGSAFPNLQFLFSTHSPLVAGALEAANILVMESQPDGTVVPARYRERIYGLTANQVLTSSYFGLRSTRAPGTGSITAFPEPPIRKQA
jgi:energy-coupling factor transporter ATP-binding protein EcfA2